MAIKYREELMNLLESGYIDIESMSTSILAQSFEFTNERMMIVYDFVLNYIEYMSTKHFYTQNDALTTLEAHLLTDICEFPNLTVTSLANSWTRSVSATSQTIRKLIQKDLVTRVNSKEDAKVFYLEPTEKGIQVSMAHKGYDVLDTVKTFKSLLKTLTIDEIETMFKGLEAFTMLLKKARQKTKQG